MKHRIMMAEEGKTPGNLRDVIEGDVTKFIIDFLRLTVYSKSIKIKRDEDE